MRFKVKISKEKVKEMTEEELRKIVGEFIIEQVKENGAMAVPVVNQGKTYLFDIETVKPSEDF